MLEADNAYDDPTLHTGVRIESRLLVCARSNRAQMNASIDATHGCLMYKKHSASFFDLRLFTLLLTMIISDYSFVSFLYFLLRDSE